MAEFTAEMLEVGDVVTANRERVCVPEISKVWAFGPGCVLATRLGVALLEMLASKNCTVHRPGKGQIWPVEEEC